MEGKSLMKILFVEDELTKNISRIINIFSDYLDKNIYDELKEIENDESGYGADPRTIKNIIEKSDLVEVEYRFPDALDKILNNSDNYSLFIVDRNLAESEYRFEEVQTIDPVLNKNLQEKFYEREGDYLLQRLVYMNVNVKNKFYFLTAYSAEDEIRNSEYIKQHIEFEKFNQRNFIEKGNSEHLRRMKDIIKSNRVISIQNENKLYLRILRNRISDDAAFVFFKVLSELDDEKRISDNLNEVRKVYEFIINVCADNIPDMKKNCANRYGAIRLGQETIDWLTNNKLINSIHRQFFFSLKSITSDFGAHTNPEKSAIYKPTIDTVKSLTYMLKDSILWLDEIIRESEQK